jgi:light-regulated signal transduction histidine kinase (bacteriophytochrome)
VVGGTLARIIRYAIARERAEQQIRNLNEELEHRVKVRTAELEAANKELETFSYSVSHDLRAPLRHIDGFSKILAESHVAQLDDDGRKCLDRICESADRMGHLIDDLLKLSRVGRQVLAMQSVPLSTLVNSVVDAFKADTNGRQIEWRMGALPSVICDAGLVRQVFDNLIGNAIKYSRKRTIAVIEVGQTIDCGSQTFFVRDNGAGFEMKYASRLFGAFQRLHDAREFEGTGIGLATVRRIVERHGGRIWAESELEKGATFYFTLGPQTETFQSRPN